MYKMVYKCLSDGELCYKAIPKFDEYGYLIPESNKKVLELFSGKIGDHILESAWDKCLDCSRCTNKGETWGTLRCENGIIEKL